MRCQSNKKLKKGFTLVEVVVGLVILSSLLVGAIKLLADTQTLQSLELTDKSKKLAKTTFQEESQNGFIGQNDDFEIKSIEVDLPKGRCCMNSRVGEHTGSQENRSSSAIHTLSTYGNEIERVKQKLNSPRFSTDGNVAAKSLPLKNIVIFPQNPLGTYYTFTNDGSEPSANSTPWDHRIISLANVPKELKMRAFNPSHIASETSTLQFNLSWDLQFEREGKDASNYVKREEIDQRINKIVLNTGVSGSGAVTKYRFSQNEPEREYTGPFHVPTSYWTETGAKLYVSITPKSGQYPDIEECEYDLRISKSKLLAPVVKMPANNVMAAGSSIEIQFPQPIYSSYSILLDGSSDDSLWAQTNNGVSLAYDKIKPVSEETKKIKAQSLPNPEYFNWFDPSEVVKLTFKVVPPPPPPAPAHCHACNAKESVIKKAWKKIF